MYRIAHRSLLLLAFLLLATVARGQFDTCITFAEISGGSSHPLPSTWTVAHGANYSLGSDAYINSAAHDTPKALYLTPNTDFYVSMPYISADFSQGAYMQFWAMRGWSVEVGTMTDPNNPATFHFITQFSASTGNNWKRYVVDLSSAPQGDH